MNPEFEQFIKKISPEVILDWKRIQKHFRIKEKRYPSNQRMIDHFLDNFVQYNTKTTRIKWHKLDKLLLIWSAHHYARMQDCDPLNFQLQHFQQLSRILRVSQNLLQTKWIKLLRTKLKTTPWEMEEMEAIRDLMKTQLNSKWTEIAIQLFQKKISPHLRTAKQVRERWVNYIDPNLRRDDWTTEQDQILMSQAKKIGRKWSQLGRILERSQNSIKNRYFSLQLRKEKIKKLCQQIRNQREDNENRIDIEVKVESTQDKELPRDSRKMCGYRELLCQEVNNIQIVSK